MRVVKMCDWLVAMELDSKMTDSRVCCIAIDGCMACTHTHTHTHTHAHSDWSNI